MNYITLLSVTDDEIGCCNHEQLYALIEEHRPDVIFEELPQVSFEAIYANVLPDNLVTLAVKKYLKNYGAKHFSVREEIAHLVDDRMENDSQKIYSNLMDDFQLQILQFKLDLLTQENGLSYLNSNDYKTAQDELRELQLQKINAMEPSLKDTGKRLQAIIQIDYEQMVNKIYVLCKTQQVVRGLFLVSAQFRALTEQIIGLRQLQGNTDITWNSVEDMV